MFSTITGIIKCVYIWISSHCKGNTPAICDAGYRPLQIGTINDRILIAQAADHFLVGMVVIRFL